jgi:hypothetical protein
MSAIYVYAIIPSGDTTIFDVDGVRHPHKVFSVPCGDLAAVVSASQRTDYHGLQRDEAVSYLTRHQRVVEKVMESFSLLPVKFGTVFPDEGWVRTFLEQGQARFCEALDRCAGLTQMEVVVLWNMPEVFQEISLEEPIAQLKAEVLAHPGEPMEAERVAVGQLVQASLQRRLAALHERLVAALQGVGQDLIVNPALNDATVANVAILVDAAGRQALDQRLEALDREFAGRLDFRCVGPLPPYSFATVEAQLPSFEAVEQARCRLGLGEVVTTDEIRRAYRHLAR